MACCGRHGKVTFVAFFACVGAFLFGLDMGYVGDILSDPSFKRDVAHMDNWESYDSEIASAASGFIVGSFALGCIVTSFPTISSAFLDRLGRKVSIMVGAVVYAMGTTIQAAASSMSVFVIGRLVSGFSIGILSTVVPLYQSEIAPPELRGNLTSLFQWMIIAGVVIAALLNQLLLPIAEGWRIAIGLQTIPALLLFCGMIPLPRSPRWLVQQHRPEEAMRAMQKYLPQEEVESEFQEIVRSFEEEEKMGQASWSEIFTGRGSRLLVVGMAIQLLQQLQGINAIVIYGPRIFKAIDMLEPNTSQTITNLVLLLGTTPAPFLMDRLGRRKLLAWSAALQGLPSLVIGIAGLTSMVREGDNWRTTNEVAGYATAIAVLIYVFNFGYGWGPTVWVYCGEMFPLKVRSRCVGLTTMSNWIGVYIVGQMTPILLANLGFGAFLLFSACSVLSFALALWLPETKGVVLERVDELFDQKLGVRGQGRRAVEKKALDSEDLSNVSTEANSAVGMSA
mmetsp:Transcript_23324/g.59547  ORF Transcript_23324/g.59547 Transcript_23324/m.59547 type:complete len:508 (+) Transcript_23324:83-1606(+)|eukprot:CAMPEP_0195058218 /NCGR_PEP_ID=MMETSP0448-20130528/6171_1 /TAXON_ID=66468 /ORGANISM="Heterocapsa triquestra, Strain CCMP 448" /LENGTH=507 /DNA_ID=CAMNT_0040088353 /DNA_START=28 /DNA_END=1551 /DNA_ORIENTATION=-